MRRPLIDQETEKAVKHFVRRIAGHYDIAGVILYGSRARGTHRPDSDADVAILLRGEPTRFLSTKLDMADIAFDILLETDILISPLPVRLAEWEHPETHANPALLQNIIREGIWVWPEASEEGGEQPNQAGAIQTNIICKQEFFQLTAFRSFICVRQVVSLSRR